MKKLTATSSALLLAALILSLNASAQTSAGWTGVSAISDLRVYNGSSIYGRARDLTTITTCPSGSASSNSFLISSNTTLLPEVYAILLTAQATGKKVQLYRTGSCSGNHAVINGAQLKD